MEHLHSIALFLHLLAYAAWGGSEVAQQQLMKRSRNPRVDPAVRDADEQAAASLILRLALPAGFVAILTGVGLLYFRPTLLQQPAMHMKLTMVALLLVLTHLEMFNARRIVRLRAGGGDSAQIADRKSRHAAYGSIGAILAIGIVAIVAFVIRG